ncbi:hypothetical protein A0T30_09720 [Aquipseudomonas alcaligenes]|nr:hypothetical protein A0T30_09720 [Pseudomonas alcaligenes]
MQDQRSAATGQRAGQTGTPQPATRQTTGQQQGALREQHPTKSGDGAAEIRQRGTQRTHYRHALRKVAGGKARMRQDNGAARHRQRQAAHQRTPATLAGQSGHQHHPIGERLAAGGRAAQQQPGISQQRGTTTQPSPAAISSREKEHFVPHIQRFVADSQTQCGQMASKGTGRLIR